MCIIHCTLKHKSYSIENVTGSGQTGSRLNPRNRPYYCPEIFDVLG